MAEEPPVTYRDGIALRRDHLHNFRIETLYAFLVVAPNGDEGLPAMQHGNVMMPLMSADPERREIVREIAERMCLAHGVTVEEVEFTVRRHVSWIRPKEDA